MVEEQIEAANKRMKLGFDFTDYLIDNPSEIERLPDAFEIWDELEHLTPKEFVDILAQQEAREDTEARKVYEFA